MRGAQVDITITGADGNVFRKLSGPASAGLNSVTWNYRGEAPPAAAPGPYDKREQARIAERAKVVADSLKEAGWDAQVLDRMMGLISGRTGRDQAFAMFMGGGGGRDPEAFRDRPGETAPGSASGGGMDYGQMREVAELVTPGGGMGGLFRRFGGSGGQAALAEPGNYTVTLKVGDKTYTQSLKVGRQAGYTGNNSPFEEDWEEFLAMMGVVR